MNDKEFFFVYFNYFIWLSPLWHFASSATLFQSFIFVLDPADVEEASQRPLVLTPQTPPINASAQEEEISLLLGTLQVQQLPDRILA